MEKTQTLPNLLGPKILIVLYSIIGLIPRFEAVDPIGSQWFYFGIVTLLGFGFLLKAPKELTIFPKHRWGILFFGAYSLFLLISIISLWGTINVPEGVKDIARIAITLGATLNMYFLFKMAPKQLFEFVVKAVHIVVLIIGIQIVFYFLENIDTLRSTKLLKGTELLFGNRNVTAAALAIQLPFVIWGVLRHTGSWKIVSLISFFIGFTALFYVGARSALLSFVLYFAVFIIYLVVDGIRVGSLSRKLKYPILPILGILVVGFLLVTNTNRVDKGKANSYKQILTTVSVDASGKVVETVVKKSRSSGFDSGRLIYFEMAVDDFKANPLTGVGIGNWKLSNKDKYFAASVNNKFIYPLRVHSDFLQVLAEVGILGGLGYFGMLALLTIGVIRLVLKNPSQEERWMYLILMLALMAYGVDANLNFPLERTPIQGLYAVIAALIITFVTSNNKETKTVGSWKVGKPMLAGIGIVLLGATIISFLKYQSYVNQNYILADTSGKNLMVDKYAYSYEQALQRLDGYFTIGGVGRPNEHVKGMYAMSEGRLDLALNHLDKSMKIGPNHYESTMLKAIIYGQKMVNNDSAVFYAKKGFEKYPAIKNNYVLLLNAYRAMGDTVNYFKTYDERLAFDPQDVSQWKAKSTRIMEFYKDPVRAAAVVDEAIKANPTDSSLIRFKDRFTSRERETDIRAWYSKAFELIKENKHAEAKVEFMKILEVTPTNNPTLLNLGIIEIKLKQYEDAVAHLTKVIEAKAFADGRPEYNRGLAYERLGQDDKSKVDYRRSKSLGYPLAQKLPESKLK